MSEAASELTRRITAVAGVRGLFPQSVTAAVLAVMTSEAGEALVDLADHGDRVEVRARLATARDVPSPRVLALVAEVVADFVGPRPVTLHVEFAHID